MGLAWTFVGYSKGYNYFTGFGEVTAGILLLFKRTTTLGALVAFVIAANIMAINYCFDVPVKLLSTALVVMSIFLLARDIKRLVNFFILNKPAAALDIHTPKFRKRWANITAVLFKYALIVFVLYSNISGGISGLKKYGDEAKKSSLYGIYNVEHFVLNHDTIPPLTTNTVRWDKLVVEAQDYALVKRMNQLSDWYSFKLDSVKRNIEMSGDDNNKSFFTYSFTAGGQLIMDGIWKNDTLHVTFNKYDKSKFLLVNRGFHWVNEYPLNK